MIASASILATRAGLPVYIPTPPPKVVLRLQRIETSSARCTPGVTLVEYIGRRTLVRRPNSLMVPATYLARYGSSR